jgi:lysophospholipase L1-like esterase
MHARRGWTIVVLALFAALATALPTAAQTQVAPHTYQDYVALGDSYTAGPLIPPQRLDPLTCFRSGLDYPAQLAIRLRVASFHDVSCSGANTSDMTGPQELPLGVNPPQLDALSADTDLVTLSIGGNDDNVFGTVTSTCPGLRASDPTGNPCQQHFTVDGVDTIQTQITHTQDNITAVLAEIHRRAPRAEVVVIGYPRITPPSGTCPSLLPFADGDYTWLAGVERELNSALSNAVSTDGDATYVDTYGPSLGHDVCAGSAAWINGQYFTLTAAPYHPNLAGMTGEARIVYAALH